ncbi:hypothetical protein [Actinomadura sp. 9N407]|uniref:hypothetical protein n=1 Tax=Actinomadura sp. 9N407 TaxID=3375154 RepID=UPI0037BAF164
MRERPPTPAEVAEAARREQERLAEELAPITVSTLSTASRPYEQHDVIYGEPCDDAGAAMVSLKLAARTAGCDAVLGVGFGSAEFRVGQPVVLNGVPHGQSRYRLFAYGTAIRWLPE